MVDAAWLKVDRQTHTDTDTHRHTHTHTHTHRSTTRTGACTLNARVAGDAWPLPHHLVCVEKFTWPDLT